MSPSADEAARRAEPPLPRSVEAFLDHLARGAAPGRLTLDSYRRDLVLLARYAAGESRAIEALDLADLEAFVRDLMTRGLLAALGRAPGRRGARLLHASWSSIGG